MSPPGHIDWSVSRIHVRGSVCWLEAWYLPTTRHRGLRKSCIRFASLEEAERAIRDDHDAVIARLEREGPVRDEEQRRMDEEPVEERLGGDGVWRSGPDAAQGVLF